MLINGTHATTPTNLPTNGTGTPTGTGTGTGSSSTSAAGAVGTLGGTDFLTLMLAQLQNQDPTSPVDSNTFLTQLAQLSEVQGITSLNTSFGALSTSLTSNQALQASSLLGHQALVNSSTATIAAGAAVTGAGRQRVRTRLGKSPAAQAEGVMSERRSKDLSSARRDDAKFGQARVVSLGPAPGDQSTRSVHRRFAACAGTEGDWKRSASL
jgi:hypothetical protein